MAYRVEEKKLLFLHHLISLPDSSRAKQFYVQQKLNSFPGLVLECKQLMSKYELDDITEVQSLPTKITWKKQVQAKIKAFCEEQLKTEIRDKYSKLDNIDIENENFESKAYLKELDLSHARIKFKLRSRMLEVKNNFRREHTHAGLECQGCQTSIDTQDHVLFCPFFSDLSQDLDFKNDRDLVHYYKKVMEFCDKMKKRKISK